jgi:predicted nucleic acid-binding protein
LSLIQISYSSSRLAINAVSFRELREILSILRAVCAVKPDVETHERGLDVAERYQFSIYDSMIAAALQSGVLGALHRRP